MRHPSTFRAPHAALRLTVALAAIALASCGGGRNFPKVYPVKGKILVNGQPAHDCQIFLSRTSAESLAVPATPQAVTDKNGEFQITSYHSNDGAPEGEYVVTIEWRERSGIMKQEFEGVDLLGGAYAKVEKTRSLPGFVVKVERQPLELPPFELTQSAEAKRKAEEAKRRRPGFDGHGPLGSGDK
jgi:hypothetical protein